MEHQRAAEGSICIKISFSKKNTGTPMKKTILTTSALICGLAFAAVPAVAQDPNGPGSANYGSGNNPTTGSKIYQSTEGNAGRKWRPWNSRWRDEIWFSLE
jgi:hypothetical protein